jgi:hypothetical protein
MSEKFKSLASSAMSKVTELTYASTPYIGAIWSAVSKGNILEASPIALAATAKEHHFQYTELVKDAERASSYVASAALYIDYLETQHICNVDSLKKAYKDLYDLVKTLQADKGIREMLNKQQLLLNDTLSEYNKTHNVNKYLDKVQTLSEKMFVKSWPGWYRIELSSHVNRMNMLFDEAMIELSQKDKKACTLKPKLKPVTVPQPISLDKEAEDIFYDAIQQKQQKGGKPAVRGRRRRL